MPRLKRFEDYRFVGDRTTMRFYDTDDAEQAAALQARVESEALAARNQLQAFAPDEPAEARNRGFKQAAVSTAR
jgi:hypothetical protein